MLEVHKIYFFDLDSSVNWYMSVRFNYRQLFLLAIYVNILTSSAKYYEVLTKIDG